MAITLPESMAHALVIARNDHPRTVFDVAGEIKERRAHAQLPYVAYATNDTEDALAFRLNDSMPWKPFAFLSSLGNWTCGQTGCTTDWLEMIF